MTSQHVVYALLDLTDHGRVFYVGWTKNLPNRLKSHFGSCEKNQAKSQVVARHKALGQLPGVAVLEEHSTDAAAKDAERRLIAWFRQLGHPLTNAMDGGEGEFERYVASRPWLNRKADRPKRKPGRKPRPIVAPARWLDPTKPIPKAPRKVAPKRVLSRRSTPPVRLRQWSRCSGCQRWSFGCRRCANPGVGV